MFQAVQPDIRVVFYIDCLEITQSFAHFHNMFRKTDFQNYLRTQTGNNTTVNIIISTVDYLLRVQVSLERGFQRVAPKIVGALSSASL